MNIRLSLINRRFAAAALCILLTGLAIVSLASLETCETTPGVYAAVEASATAAIAQRNGLDFDANVTAKGDINLRFKDTERDKIILAYATAKGYKAQVWSTSNGEFSVSTLSPNPQTPAQFVADYLERDISEVLLSTDIQTARTAAETATREAAKTRLPKPTASNELLIKP